jgi:hypothetical protein
MVLTDGGAVGGAWVVGVWAAAAAAAAAIVAASTRTMRVIDALLEGGTWPPLLLSDFDIEF